MQTGPPGATPAESVERGFELARVASGDPLDLIVFPELFARPFWCVGLSDRKYFSWAEPVSGETLATARALARRTGCHAVVPFFERGRTEGEHYNSAALVGPDGDLIPGRLPSGDSVAVYRKNAVSSYNWGGSINDEKYYFREGPGFPVFDTDLGTIGILICYDRWFPEAWRVLALQGAEVICVPNASVGSASDLFVASMQTWAAQNVVYAIAVNRGGCETLDGIATEYYGLSCIVSPRGQLIANTPFGAPEAVVIADLDLDEVRLARLDLTMYRDRRPELYGRLGEP
ncbi:MAG: carbon-nitrogen hydrolase family protein [Acidimicrobiales bacterium]